MIADSGPGGLARGAGFGRGGVNSFAERREAARQRLTTTARAALVVDETLQTLDRRLAAWVIWRPSSASTPVAPCGRASAPCSPSRTPPLATT